MATESTSMSLNDLLSTGTVMSDNIKLNAATIGRYGLELPAFTDEFDSDLKLTDRLNKEQERIKSELKQKTDELNEVKKRIEQNFSLAKKTVKLAEPQTNWVAYGITDKK